jgi:hypothetical protein
MAATHPEGRGVHDSATRTGYEKWARSTSRTQVLELGEIRGADPVPALIFEEFVHSVTNTE